MYRPRQQRDQRWYTVGTSDVVIASPNPKRRALLVGSPKGPDLGPTADGALSPAADTSVAGPYAIYTVAAGAQATLVSATMLETTGTTVVAQLQLIRGANPVGLASILKAGTVQLNLPLESGDVVQWKVTTTVAASVTDFSTNVSLGNSPVRVTISFTGPAVAEQGLTLGVGMPLLYLHEDWIGSAITEDVHAVASQAGVLVPVLDVFDG